MSLAWPFKDHDEFLDYEIDWTPRLVDGDTIASQEWIKESGDDDLTMSNESIVSGSTKTIVWLAGGTIGSTYVLTNRVTTDDGRIMDASVKIKIKEK